MKKIYNFTNGKLNKGSSNKFLPVYNPSTGEKTSEVISSNSEDFLTILDNAKKSFYKWSNFTPLNRSRVISKYKQNNSGILFMEFCSNYFDFLLFHDSQQIGKCN